MTAFQVISEIVFEAQFVLALKRFPRDPNHLVASMEHTARRLLIARKSPYVIMFENRDALIFILGIFHAASDRGGWFDRSL